MDVCERATRAGFGMSLDAVGAEISPSFDWGHTVDSSFLFFTRSILVLLV